MIVPRSVPGSWFAVITDGLTVLLPSEATPALLDEVWLALRDGADVDDAVRVVGDAVSSYGAFSVVGGAVHARLLGDVVLTVSTDEGRTVLEGARGRCTQHDLGPVQGLLLEAVGAERRPGGPLPVLSAVVPSAAVELVLDEATTARDSIDDATILTLPRFAPSPAEALDDLAEDDDTILKVTPELRAEVEARAAADAAADMAATVLAEGPSDGGAEPAAAPELDEDHLDAMTVLGVDAALRAQVDAIAEVEGTRPAPVPSTPRPAPPAPPVPPAPPAPVAASSIVQGAADHDGLTVMSSDLVEIRKSLPTWTGDRVPGPFAVPAGRGPAKLVMSSGLVVTLERVVLIGRAPVVSRVPNRSLPRLVTVPSPHHDISRTHAQVQDDGDRVFVTDLHSTNGVVVHTAGSAPIRLAPGVPTLLAVGATVDIGDGVTFSVVRDR